MKKNIVFFDLSVTGHHLEYFHHINVNVGLIEANDICFLVDVCFEALYKEAFAVEINPEIKLQPITQEQSDLYHSWNGIKKYGVAFSILRKFLKENQIQECFLMDIYPFTWFTWREKLKARLSGIYFIPIVKPAASFSDKLKVFLIKLSLKRNSWTQIFVLNNKSIAQDLNTQYKTDALFESISDPILNIKELKLQKHSAIHAFSNKISFLHIGALAERKGTLDILNAVESMNIEEAGLFEIVIAGKSGSALSEKINERIAAFAKKGLQNIHFYNKKLSYDEFASILNGCSYVLLPYRIPIMSSGIIGHAVNFNKPIIGPANGLMGDIIQKYKLGICINPGPEEISKVIRTLIGTALGIESSLGKEYLYINSPEQFVKTINTVLC